VIARISASLFRPEGADDEKTSVVPVIVGTALAGVALLAYRRSRRNV
jgi:LPXTG-motif cell wall-anchored protein